MYIKKCVTSDAVFDKIRYPEKINNKQLRKVLVPLKLKQDKDIPKTHNDFPQTLLPVDIC